MEHKDNQQYLQSQDLNKLKYQLTQTRIFLFVGHIYKLKIWLCINIIRVTWAISHKFIASELINVYVSKSYIYYNSVGCHLITLWVCGEPSAI